MSACLLFLFSLLFSSAHFALVVSSPLLATYPPPPSPRKLSKLSRSWLLPLLFADLPRGPDARPGEEGAPQEPVAGWASPRAGGWSPGPSRSLPRRRPPARPRAAELSNPAARGRPEAASRTRGPKPRTRSRRACSVATPRQKLFPQSRSVTSRESMVTPK